MLLERGLRPAAELAVRRGHGDRLRYLAGCRCDECRQANSRYERERQAARKAGDWNGLVPAGKARSHLLKLSRLGVGRRAVAAASDVADTVLSEIRQGRKTTIRARTERKILAVGKAQASDRALVDAKRTWSFIDDLLEEGYTIALIAERLGYARPYLQFKRDGRVTVRTQARVERLHRELTQ